MINESGELSDLSRNLLGYVASEDILHSPDFLYARSEVEFYYAAKNKEVYYIRKAGDRNTCTALQIVVARITNGT